jgi:histidinol-phosphate/aromatic aminotransferase/cobyric acid decarboxylase-like protein
MPSRTTRSKRIRISLATERDRRTIYGLRHDVYATEIRQHKENAEKQIHDALDQKNVYIVARVGDQISGFISITPPQTGVYSLDKYLRRDELPFDLDEGTYEIRILTVLPAHRGTATALLLMYASLRWVEAHGGTRIVSLGRREIRGLYVKAGLLPLGRDFRSGSVEFVLMSERVKTIRDRLMDYEGLLDRRENIAEWDLVVPFRKPADCFHGGAFFTAVGDEFDHLDRSSSVINADVLDAWFPPSPRVIHALESYLPWLLRTSPPIGSEGMIRTIARTRGLDAKCILPGAGSSSLIYLALREWLTPSSRVLLPEPTYGEYAHVLDNVIRCRVDRLVLTRENHYRIDRALLESALDERYDLIVLVNPNSPTGQHMPREELESFLRHVPADTLVWIDETYVDYVGSSESLEEYASGRENIVVCKSMSKVYALSGLRCAYLCASPHLLEQLRAISPPWAVSLPAQVAAVAALQDDHYYAERYRQTGVLRAQLSDALSSLPSIDVVPGLANFLLCHLPENGPPASVVDSRCRERGLFIRDASTMGTSIGRHAIRIAVKERPTIDRMMKILSRVLSAGSGRAEPKTQASVGRAARSCIRG